jgi:predicted phage terminase large subunit-like protein
VKTVADIKQQLLLLNRQKRVLEARDSMLAFGHFMTPDTSDPDDADKSEYIANAPAKCLCSLVEDIERGDKLRVGVSMPPQHGKTLNLSLLGAAWIMGRNPRARIVIGTYSQSRAEELGKDILALLDSTQYKQVFPNIAVEPSIRSRSYIQNTLGGRIMLVGVGGAVTGKTANFFFIDDPIKGEADESDLTPVALERLWGWFFKIAYSRGSNTSRILITHTRWAEDDLLGRLCDPEHPERNKRYKGISDKWFYLNLPAVVKDENLANVLGLKLHRPTDKDVVDMFGNDPMTTLWPENKDLSFFAEWKRGDPRGFSALAMGSPAPEDGVYFTKEMLVEYNSPAELPESLTIYGASDHAVSLKQGRDSTVIGCAGVDHSDDIWVLPDLVWDKMETDRTVEEMLSAMRNRKPSLWWAEDENIRKAFGPFLIKRMHETKTYCTMDPIVPAGDKKTRARSIQGRMSMRKVHFPAFAPWWPDAKAQLLRFPHASHDDFVDWLSLFGLGLLKEIAADAPVSTDGKIVRVGSIEWIMAASKKRAEQGNNKRSQRGW